MTEPEEYILPSTEEESQRLERQGAELYGGVQFLEPFLVDAERPKKVLDAGCGSGYFTRHVASAVPEAEVVGLDLDEGRIAFAKSHSRSTNSRFERGDLTKMSFESDLFDLVFCRFVLVHQRDPAAALREMARVTRSGGRVVAYDIIHDGIWFSPPKPSLEKLLRTTFSVLRERGAEPNQGLHLPVAMKRAGLADVDVEVIPHYAMSGTPLFDAARKNWRDTATSLGEQLGSHFEEGLVEAALSELESQEAHEFQLEITVLAHGRV